MRYKTILIPLRTIETAEHALPVAINLARQHDAHLIGVHVAEQLINVAYPAMIGDIAVYSAEQKEQTAALKALFEKMTANQDIQAEYRSASVLNHIASDVIIEHCRGADLVVMAQANPDNDATTADDRLDRVIRKCGRPVLVVPYAGEFSDLGANVLVGWSSTREAARAAHDALPIFKDGAKVRILTAHGASAGMQEGVETAKEMALCYDRHGVSAEVVERVEEGISVGDLLLNEAFEQGSDLIVVGAFGHSRVYDLVIGAVTTKLLSSMTVPVLFSS